MFLYTKLSERFFKKFGGLISSTVITGLDVQKRDGQKCRTFWHRGGVRIPIPIFTTVIEDIRASSALP